MNNKEKINLPIFREIGQVADRLGLDAFLIGGYVRDLLLERVSKDIDVVCLGSGIELANACAKQWKIESQVVVFKNFGTAMLKYQDWEIEFVGARKESYHQNSRKPVVENGNLKDDQNRRDFTINALAIQLNESNFGRFLDPFNGINDLKSRTISTPLDPDITFSDDPLRMMRAVRFASQLSFKINPITIEGIKRQSHRIEIVSQERVIDELNKIILSIQPSKGFKLLSEVGLLERIFPEFEQLRGVDYINGKGHKDNFYHTLEVLDNISLETSNLWLRWAAILHDIAKPATKRFDKKQGWTFHGHEDKGARMVPQIFKRLKLPLDQKMKFVQKLVKLHLRPISLVKDSVTDSAVRRLLFEAGEDIDGLMMLCHADITTKNIQKQKRYIKNFEVVKEKLQEVEEKDKLRNWQPPISGDDIMKIYDLPPSKTVGILKNAVREAILDGIIQNDRNDAIDFLNQQVANMNLEK